jgi:hypothetical protein
LGIDPFAVGAAISSSRATTTRLLVRILHHPDLAKYRIEQCLRELKLSEVD